MSTTCDWTIDEFLRVPVVEDPTGIEAVAFVILPQEQRHESGFRMMSLVLIGKDGLPVGRVDCGSDVIALNGIGGGGEDWLAQGLDGRPIDWQIDCLPGSGLLRMWCCHTLEIRPRGEGDPLRAGGGFSTFEIFVKRAACLAREQPPLTAMLLLQLSPTAIPNDEFPREIDVDL